MFSRESEMVTSVTRWLRSAGLTVKQEFVIPWGICDLVGLSFNEKSVANRLSLGQRKAVSSITRAALLLRVPEVESTKSVSIGNLVKDFSGFVPKDVVVAEMERLIADRFVVRSHRGRLHKLNGWMPLQERLVAVELKLSRVEEAFQQAESNLGFAQESYVAFPMPVARHIANSKYKWSGHFANGIGLIGVLKRRCEALIPASASPPLKDPAVQFYCVEKFWKSRSRD